MKLKYFAKQQEGQTILEALIAITVIIVGLFSVLTLVLTNVRAARVSNYKIFASILSWEGAEVVKNIRDSNWLANNPWNLGLADAGDTTLIPVFDSGTGSWTLDYTPDSFSDAATRIYKNGTVFTHDPAGAEITRYFRLVTIAPDDPVTPSFITVTSEVRWSEQGEWKSVISEELLYNWR